MLTFLEQLTLNVRQMRFGTKNIFYSKNTDIITRTSFYYNLRVTLVFETTTGWNAFTYFTFEWCV